MTTSKRKRLSLREKVDILDYRKNNGNVGIRALAEKVDILDYRKNTGNVGIRALAEKFQNKCEGSVIDKKLLVWFSKTREKNLPVSGPTIQEMAKRLAGVHGLNDFKASNGWLEKFRKRHNISFKSICGEASAVDRIAVDDWKKQLKYCIGLREQSRRREIKRRRRTTLHVTLYRQRGTIELNANIILNRRYRSVTNTRYPNRRRESYAARGAALHRLTRGVAFGFRRGRRAHREHFEVGSGPRRARLLIAALCAFGSTAAARTNNSRVDRYESSSRRRYGGPVGRLLLFSRRKSRRRACAGDRPRSTADIRYAPLCRPGVVFRDRQPRDLRLFGLHVKSGKVFHRIRTADGQTNTYITYRIISISVFIRFGIRLSVSASVFVSYYVQIYTDGIGGRSGGGGSAVGTVAVCRNAASPRYTPV
ncbi:Homeobox domain-like,HTH CenpB-type DNA-binding domain [Cinara cedri]|uniref:Homeobox domain-like,HTH CenpB-type DNA-binding domain n=1 Tax=Cinara cedri TaxID=506608 RepID=A0A5E4NP95_9HEMI|nr:Homeobox domain-like,HTH CenpB-type DNA-binding domain [Cinara cedri]